MAIVLCHFTSKYFLYLFGSWDCLHTNFVRNGQIQAVYVRHRPETTLLYQIVQEYWPEFQVELTNHGKYLSAYVTKEFDEYLKCGRLEHGFLRVRCDSCHEEKLVAFSCKKRGFCPSCGARRMADSAALLGIVYRVISTHLAHKGGFAKPLVQTGAVTLIQRFGSALNLNIPQGTFS